MGSIQIGVLLTYLTIILGNAISLIYTPIMLGIIGQQEYGLFSLVNSIIAYIHLMDMGFGNAIIRYNVKYEAEQQAEQKKKLNGMFLLLYTLIGCIALVIGLVIYINIEKLFGKSFSFEEIVLVKKLFIVAIINLALSFPMSIFSALIVANERFVFSKGLNLIRTVVNPLVMLAILTLGYRSVGMVVASTLFNMSIGILNIYYCKTRLKVEFSFGKFDINLLKEIFTFSFFVFLSAIAYQIYWNTDQFILGMFIGSAPIAIYAVATQFNNYFVNFSNVLSSMFLPKLTKMVTQNVDNHLMIEELIKVSRIQLVICLYIFGGFLLIGRAFISIWAGKAYDTSYFIAMVLMVPQIFSIVQSLFATLLEAMNKHRVKAFIYLGVACINLVLTLIFVQKWGAVGCALATAIGMLINAAINNLYYTYYLKLPMVYYWKQVIKLLPAIILSWISTWMLIGKNQVVSYKGILGIGIIYTFIFIVFIGFMGMNKEEKKKILEMLRTVFKIRY